MPYHKAGNRVLYLQNVLFSMLCATADIYSAHAACDSLSRHAHAAAIAKPLKRWLSCTFQALHSTKTAAAATAAAAGTLHYGTGHLTLLLHRQQAFCALTGRSTSNSSTQPLATARLLLLLLLLAFRPTLQAATLSAAVYAARSATPVTQPVPAAALQGACASCTLPTSH
jgi:hypothetical protein